MAARRRRPTIPIAEMEGAMSETGRLENLDGHSIRLRPLSGIVPAVRADKRRAVAGLALAVYLALLASFSLPFVSVASCNEEVRTGRISGWNLVRGHAPVTVEGDGKEEREESDLSGGTITVTVDVREEVEDKTDALSDIARFDLFVLVVLLGLLLLYLKRGGSVLALAAGLCGMMEAYGILFLSNGNNNVTVDAHYGYLLAASFASFGSLTGLALAWTHSWEAGSLLFFMMIPLILLMMLPLVILGARVVI